MFKQAPWVLGLLIGATLAGPLSAQDARRQARGPQVAREGRGPQVVDRPETLPTAPLLIVDTPVAGQTVGGVVSVSGSVLSFYSIEYIELFIDGGDVPVNRAVLNLPSPNILQLFPSYAAGTPNVAPGWITSFLARNYTDGNHQLVLAVTVSENSTTFLYGPINVTVNSTYNQAPFGGIDLPTGDTTVGANGAFQVLGWALDDIRIDHVDFQLDGITVASAVNGGVGTATYGGTRPDIYAAFPDFQGPQPQSLYSGFAANIDTTDFVDGLHQLVVRAWDDQGAASDLGTRNIQIMNNSNLLPPFGELEHPMDEATLICGPAIVVTPPTGPCPSPCVPDGGGGEIALDFFPNLVRGWALDTAVRLDPGQVSYVELMLDGALLANTRTDCTVTGTVAVNCDHLSRPDIAQTYPSFVNASNSGFAFNFGLSSDPRFGLLDILVPTPFGVEIRGFTMPGSHTLSLRVGDVEDTVTEFGTIPVNVTCDMSSTSPDRASFGDVDSPTQDQFINGAWPVFGWAFDFDSGVTRVDLAVDGVVLASLTKADGTYGIRRDDVPASDRRVTTPNVGFAYTLDTTRLGDTQHYLTVYAFDTAGRSTLIGRRTFVVFNNNPVKS